jgi:hypothetical protein
VDQKEFAERVARLQEIGGAIEKLPPEIRSGAFKLLRAYVAGIETRPVNKSEPEAERNHSDDTNLFILFSHDKPSDNVRLIAASLYQ